MGEFESLLRQVLDLPLNQRSALAETLLESLDELTPEELQQIWAAEAERRHEAFKAGKLDAHDGPETHRQILDQIR